MISKKKIFFLLVVPPGILIITFFLYNFIRTSDIPGNDSVYLRRLKNISEFNRFAGAPLDNAYANISSVKTVYDLKRKQIYFINSGKYKLHYDFCSAVLGYKLGLNLFNLANYGDKRDYYLANINYLKKNNLFVLEFGPYDEIDSLQIIEMYEHVSKSSFFKGKLQLLLNNTNTIRYFSRQKTIPTCDIATLNDGLTYQLIQGGTCSGRLVVCTDLKSQFLSITPNDIIIIKGTPTEIPICSGIISDCFQTPLSHIQVLSHNKKIPSAYLKNSLTNDSINYYNGKLVKIVISADTLLITPATITTAVNRPVKKIVLSLNTDHRSTISLENCGSLSNADIGTKAKGLADLKIVSDRNKDLFHTPEGAFVIPFYFYKKHLQASGVEPLLLLLRKCDFNQTQKIDSLLKKIRAAIMETPIDAKLLTEVSDRIHKNNIGESCRFRSSSNAEDLQNFNGAGIYDSKTGSLKDAKKPVESAIKKVWASMYNYRAYQERSFANIDETTAAMSILAHRNFPDEDINGVVISKNIYRNNYPGLVINAQKGDVSTVEPPDSVLCEQLILSENKLMNPFSKKISAKYISYSSLQPDRPLLSYDQLLLLQKSMNAIKDYYASKKTDWDIEFKFLGDKLYLKQIRPYR